MEILELPQNPAFPKFEWKEEWEGSIKPPQTPTSLLHQPDENQSRFQT